jgi:outer membrane lipoprotein carrier protein
MSWLLAISFFLFQGAKPSVSNFNAVLNGVDRSFARMYDFSADFVQIQEDTLHQKQQGVGHLYLMRSKKARYEYVKPEELVFVSDGKNLYFYVPADRQVQTGTIRDSFDDRIPLLFLVGQANLREEFTSFELLRVPPEIPGTMVIGMHPKRTTDLTELVMEVEPESYLIRRLKLSHNDGSSFEFRFSNIRVNAGLKSDLFNFKVPAGVRVVKGIGQ